MVINIQWWQSLPIPNGVGFPNLKTDGKHHSIPTFWHFMTPKSQSSQVPNSTPSIKDDTQDSFEISIQKSPLKFFFVFFSDMSHDDRWAVCRIVCCSCNVSWKCCVAHVDGELIWSQWFQRSSSSSWPQHMRRWDCWGGVEDMLIFRSSFFWLRIDRVIGLQPFIWEMVG